MYAQRIRLQCLVTSRNIYFRYPLYSNVGPSKERSLIFSNSEKYFEAGEANSNSFCNPACSKPSNGISKDKLSHSQLFAECTKKTIDKKRENSKQRNMRVLFLAREWKLINIINAKIYNPSTFFFFFLNKPFDRFTFSCRVFFFI